MDKRTYLLLIVLGILLALTIVGCNEQEAIADGSTFYVATNGSDGNPGSEAQPWLTIQHAADSVTAGDTVLVRGGVYREVVSINESGSATGGYISFESYEGETAVLDGTGFANPDGDIGFDIVGQSYIIIKGFEIRNYSTVTPDAVPIGIYVSGASHHIELRNNNIHHIASNAPLDGDLLGADAHGIAFYGDNAANSIHDIIVDGNELHDLTLGSSEALVFNGNVEQFTVSNNYIHDIDNIGIVMIGFEGIVADENLDRARDGLVQGNLVENVDSGSNPAYAGERSAGGIYVDGGTNIVIEQNRVIRANLGIELASEHDNKDASYITVRNNLVSESHVAGIAIGGYATDRGSTHHCTIVNNTFYHNDSLKDGNGELLIQFDTYDNVIKNNIFVANDQGLLIGNIFTQNNNNVVDYNLYFASTGVSGSEWQWKNSTYQGFAAYQAGTGNDAHSLFADPLFVDGGGADFHLTAVSPPVDIGDNATDSGSVDFDGNGRIQNGIIDLGAFELTAVFTPTNFVYLPTILNNT